MIPRPFYLQRMIQAQGCDFIKIITGIRRSGKSTLLRMFKDHLLASHVPADHIIEISYEKIDSLPLEDSGTLQRYVKERVTGQGPYYLLMVEVQELTAWAKTVNELRASLPLDIYVTGSNSRLFSGEYVTYITGRYIEIKVYPLSFSEFMSFKGYLPQQRDRAFNEYLRIGSFPAAALSNNEEIIESINSGLFDSIFARDIILRGKIRNEGVFLKVAKFVMENIGNPLSANSIARTLKSQGSSVSPDTIDSYLQQMVNAFVLYQCERYDIRGKQRLTTNGKYYVADMGLRNRLIGYRTGNLGRIIENIVFLELKRRGWEVSTGRIDALEIDFIITKTLQKKYIQVSLSALDEKVLSREIAPLLKVDDNYPKYLITMDTMDLSQQGIIHRNLLDFLLPEESETD